MHSLGRLPARVIALGVLALAAGAGAQTAVPSDQKFPDVVAVKVRPRGPTTVDFDVTVSSPYDSAARYADAFRVKSSDGQVYGTRELLHDHAGEQPFTRDLYGVSIPLPVKSVVVEARDQKHGWGGKTVDVAIPGR